MNQCVNAHKTKNIVTYMRNDKSYATKNVIPVEVVNANKLKFYSGIFSENKRISNILNKNKIFSDKQIPVVYDELVFLNGIGSVTAKIMLKKMKNANK